MKITELLLIQHGFMRNMDFIPSVYYHSKYNKYEYPLNEFILNDGCFIATYDYEYAIFSTEDFNEVKQYMKLLLKIDI